MGKMRERIVYHRISHRGKWKLLVMTPVWGLTRPQNCDEVMTVVNVEKDASSDGAVPFWRSMLHPMQHITLC